jgi:hypothetical protein
LQQGKPLPAAYRDLLFPPEPTPKEYELTYAGKARPEDILRQTWKVPFQIVKVFGRAESPSLPSSAGAGATQFARTT